MLKNLDQNLTQTNNIKSYTSADAVIAAVWSAFYLIAIAAAALAPIFSGAINIASR